MNLHLSILKSIQHASQKFGYDAELHLAWLKTLPLPENFPDLDTLDLVKIKKANCSQGEHKERNDLYFTINPLLTTVRTIANMKHFGLEKRIEDKTTAFIRIKTRFPQLLPDHPLVSLPGPMPPTPPAKAAESSKRVKISGAKSSLGTPILSRLVFRLNTILFKLDAILFKLKPLIIDLNTILLTLDALC